jgi:hypothetical protein
VISNPIENSKEISPYYEYIFHRILVKLIPLSELENKKNNFQNVDDRNYLEISQKAMYPEFCDKVAQLLGVLSSRIRFFPPNKYHQTKISF